MVLLLLCVLLGLGLLAQWVYQERDRLAAIRPDLKPTLEVFCRPLNCSVRALQRIDALVVDTASFNKIQTDVYRLSFTVKNLSGLALALPSVEVTLTDLQDQVVPVSYTHLDVYKRQRLRNARFRFGATPLSAA